MLWVNVRASVTVPRIGSLSRPKLSANFPNLVLFGGTCEEIIATLKRLCSIANPNAMQQGLRSHSFLKVANTAGALRKMSVIGVDGWRQKWVGVEVVESRIVAIKVFKTLDEIVSNKRYEVIAIDVPIGLPEVPPRQADDIVRRRIGARRSSVFASPPAFCLDEQWSNQKMISEESKRRFGVGVGSQTFALLHNIRAAHRVASQDSRVHEVHPEFSFFVMNNEQPLNYSKKSWNGVYERRRLLQSYGLVFSDRIDGEGGQVSIDDLLDAASCAWTADRIARNTCIAVPDQNQRSERIWA